MTDCTHFNHIKATILTHAKLIKPNPETTLSLITTPIAQHYPASQVFIVSKSPSSMAHVLCSAWSIGGEMGGMRTMLRKLQDVNVHYLSGKRLRENFEIGQGISGRGWERVPGTGEEQLVADLPGDGWTGLEEDKEDEVDGEGIGGQEVQPTSDGGYPSTGSGRGHSTPPSSGRQDTASTPSPRPRQHSFDIEVAHSCGHRHEHNNRMATDDLPIPRVPAYASQYEDERRRYPAPRQPTEPRYDTAPRQPTGSNDTHEQNVSPYPSDDVNAPRSSRPPRRSHVGTTDRPSNSRDTPRTTAQTARPPPTRPASGRPVRFSTLSLEDSRVRASVRDDPEVRLEDQTRYHTRVEDEDERDEWR
ncbi:hypothetical protein CC86DRAFT_405416 [Ophiobolus disseminans]|uniref:Uncharacterized protein n=1 Tax=Ophiobolus disseminans TaxID=1469910 RepID=A0A6A7A2C9_9PLEO|nr:hypothetical protein CC86DRAFT_405416 [Ophiobolus disseminans]